MDSNNYFYVLDFIVICVCLCVLFIQRHVLMYLFYRPNYPIVTHYQVSTLI